MKSNSKMQSIWNMMFFPSGLDACSLGWMGWLHDGPPGPKKKCNSWLCPMEVWNLPASRGLFHLVCVLFGILTLQSLYKDDLLGLVENQIDHSSDW